ncbi:hypothetical protein BLNAU_21187 [Blattamonas nauphoetae]|uniref:Uncharacterized protein n=1 Tax=Blattamonas nauphoetae TaxID=2049346 RepID=A0ABQ9WXN0_9EUKA|nr:hypothetical protein BLNAU_21187 [Blattamonas nauphoetae]
MKYEQRTLRKISSVCENRPDSLPEDGVSVPTNSITPPDNTPDDDSFCTFSVYPFPLDKPTPQNSTTPAFSFGVSQRGVCSFNPNRFFSSGHSEDLLSVREPTRFTSEDGVSVPTNSITPPDNTPDDDSFCTFSVYPFPLDKPTPQNSTTPAFSFESPSEESAPSIRIGSSGVKNVEAAVSMWISVDPSSILFT